METTPGVTSATAAFMSLFVVFAANTVTAAAPPLPPHSCADKILLVSPCLPYISQPPNDLDTNVTLKCCEVFSSIVAAGSSACLCYLIRDPAMLGFLLNTTRLLSLSLICSPNQSTAGNESLASVCSAPSPLPPLRGTESPMNQQQPYGSISPAPSPLLSPSSTPPSEVAPVPEAADDDDTTTTTTTTTTEQEEDSSDKTPTLQWFSKSAAAATRYCFIPGLVRNILVVTSSYQ